MGFTDYMRLDKFVQEVDAAKEGPLSPVLELLVDAAQKIKKRVIEEATRVQPFPEIPFWRSYPYGLFSGRQESDASKKWDVLQTNASNEVFHQLGIIVDSARRYRHDDDDEVVAEGVLLQPTGLSTCWLFHALNYEEKYLVPEMKSTEERLSNYVFFGTRAVAKINELIELRKRHPVGSPEERALVLPKN